MKKLSILKNRKLRCGGFSALLTALALVGADGISQPVLAKHRH